MLPDKDGLPVNNTMEPPQSQLLTETIRPELQRLHPDGHFLIGQDLGVYWRLTDPPLRGSIAPDWMYVPGVPPRLRGLMRRSYVMWQEIVPPTIVIEYASGDGSKERDRTPDEGKFWIYEERIRASYYAIHEVDPGRVEVYRHTGEHYHRLEPNARDRYTIEGLGLDLGIWRGTYQGEDLPWLRWYDTHGLLLPTPEESGLVARQRADEECQRADQERQRADQERQRADEARQRADRLARKLREMGIDPDQV